MFGAVWAGNVARAMPIDRAGARDGAAAGQGGLVTGSAILLAFTAVIRWSRARAARKHG